MVLLFTCAASPNAYPHFVADYHAASLQQRVVVQTEVPPVEPRGGVEANDVVALGILAAAVEGRVEDYFASDVLDGQLARDLPLVVAGLANSRAPESHLGEVGDVEEVVGPQVVVPHQLA